MRLHNKYTPYLAVLLGTFLIRIVWVFTFFNKEAFLRWMPYNIDLRAQALSLLEITGNPSAWSSLHVILAPVYGVLRLLELLEYRQEVLVVLSALGTALTATLLFAATRKLAPKTPSVAWIVAGLFAVNYQTTYFNAIITGENLVTPILAGIIYLLVFHASKRFSPISAIGIGALAAILIAIRPPLALFLLFAAIWLLISQRKHIKEIFGTVLIVIATSTILLTAFAFTNASIDSYRYAGITENGGVNAAMNWCQTQQIRYSADGGRDRFMFMPPSFRELPESSSVFTTTPFREQGYYYRMALECISEHPDRLVTNLGNIANTFSSKLYPDFNPSNYHTGLYVFWKALTIIGLVLFMVGAVLTRKKVLHRAFFTVSSLLIASQLIAVYLGNPGEERYSLPFIPFIIVGSVLALYEILQRYRGRVRIIIAILLAATLTIIPTLTTLASMQKQEGNGSTPERASGYITENEITRELLKERISRAEKYLADNIREDGLFTYYRDASNGSTKQERGLLRQFIPMQYVASQAATDKALFIIHTQNCRFLTELNPATAWNSGNMSIGELGFVARSSIHDSTCNTLANQKQPVFEALLSCVQESGSLCRNSNRNTLSDYEASFASGQTVIALVEVFEHTKDSRFLDVARRVHNHYRSRFLSAPFNAEIVPSAASWNAVSSEKLFLATKEEGYAEDVMRYADRLTPLQNTGEGMLRGQFYNPEETNYGPYAGLDATFTEAMLSAWRSAKATTNQEKQRQYRKSALLGLARIANLQVVSASTPQFTRGGVKDSDTNSWIRVDVVQHAIDAFTSGLSLFE